MLEGLLVDLVPYGERFKKLEHRWHNGEGWFWASAGDRMILTRSMIERHQQEQAEWHERHGSHSVWFGIQTKDGTPIGDMAINWMVPHARLAMLGAGIGEPEYWGGGYGTDALLLMIDYGFDWLDLRKLWLGTMAKNARVMRQMEKVGFTLESRVREEWYTDGEWVDGLLYGLLRTEWPGREAKVEELGLRERAANRKAGA
jgi:RimJ/RimL family protein N-acetyltransferase